MAYIAKKVPLKGATGRSGNKIYQDLTDNLARYPWAQAHPWQSWRSHYCKDRERFDSTIEQYVKAHPHLKHTAKQSDIPWPSEEDISDDSSNDSSHQESEHIPRTRRSKPVKPTPDTASDAAILSDDEVEEDIREIVPAPSKVPKPPSKPLKTVSQPPLYIISSSDDDDRHRIVHQQAASKIQRKRPISVSLSDSDRNEGDGECWFPPILDCHIWLPSGRTGSRQNFHITKPPQRAASISVDCADDKDKLVQVTESKYASHIHTLQLSPIYVSLLAEWNRLEVVTLVQQNGIELLL